MCELLSQHVLAHYSKFVGGIDGVSAVEQDVQHAHATVQAARATLALAQAEVAGSIAVARQSARKQRLLDLLQPLLKLQQAHNLHASLKCAIFNPGTLPIAKILASCP